MFSTALSAGLDRLRRRPGLALLLYVVNLLVGLGLSIPVYLALQQRTGDTGFGHDLARTFDLTLWADVLQTFGSVLSQLSLHLLWMLPAYTLWKIVAGIGVTFALQGSADRSFLTGIRRFLLQAVGLAFLFVLLLAAWAVVVILVLLLVSSVWEGEVAAFWINGVALPALFLFGIATLDCMHDYSRIALVSEQQNVLAAFRTGLLWPFQHSTADALYAAWFAAAAVFMLLPLLLDALLTAAAPAAIWTLFLSQQALLLLRASTTVAWLGSEVALFEMRRHPSRRDESVNISV